MKHKQDGEDNPLIIPNSTSVPNVFIDRLMPVCLPAAWKVITFIARKTFGWQKRWDGLSIPTIMQGTGLSNKAVIDALDLLISAGIVERGNPSRYGFEYRLNLKCNIEQALATLQGKRKSHPKREKPSGGVNKVHCTSELCSRGEQSSLPNGKDEQPLEATTSSSEQSSRGEQSSLPAVNKVHSEGVNKVHIPINTSIGFKTTIKKEAQEGSPSDGSAFKTTLEGYRLAKAEQGNLSRREMQAALIQTDGFNSTEIAWAICKELGLSGDSNWQLMEQAVCRYLEKNPLPGEQAGENMLALWSEYGKTVTGKYKKGWRTFFADGLHINPEIWRKKTVAASSLSAGLPSADDMIKQRRSALASRSTNQ